MKLILTSLLFLFSLQLFAIQKELSVIPFRVDSVKTDSSIPSNQSILHLTFKHNEQALVLNQPIHYSSNGVSGEIQLSRSQTAKINVEPGKNIFQFYLSDQYYEIYTDSIDFKAQEIVYATINWHQANRMIICDKPVIYLYPEERNSISVKVKPKGEFTFTYPEYNDGWSIIADPSGNLEIGTQNYNYLFWESEQGQDLIEYDIKEGFIVEPDNAVSTLEHILEEFGLNSKEKADFITFWGPQLLKSPLSHIYFIQNEQCNQFAELEISPQPDHIYRLYILITPLDEHLLHTVNEQKITPMNREGFTVIEWGGSIMNPSVINP